MLICPSCGTENPEGSRFCNGCGMKLERSVPREERKFITALFCDLVGSTALGERLDAEDISRLLGTYQAIIRRRIELHGGVVEKFIGDAVVGVFGVPLAHEDDPERAVRAALRIIEDIEASDLDIQVRIGCNTGEALVHLDVDASSGQGYATGDAMNTAARLEAAAPVMGVAIGEATHRACAGSIEFEELPDISAKGKAAPVRAWRAVRPVARVGKHERDHTPFVGRDLELRMLTRRFDRSSSRPSTEFVTLIAEAGLGKSRLVRELSRYVDELPEPITWRQGRCLPYGDGISFWALGEIVKAHAGILETDDQAAISSKLDEALSEPDPQLRAWMKDRLGALVGLQSSTEAPQRDEAFTAWRRFLEQIATKGSTVMVIEDLHWADDGFVAFLLHLAERSAGLPLLVLLTARPEVEERHPSWPPRQHSSVLSLSPLTDNEVEALITASLPGDDHDLLEIILERAGGSPLYAEQLSAMLRERALPIVGGALADSLIPPSIQALIAARIDALPIELKTVLMQASVVGRTFWSGAIAFLGEHEDLEGTLVELVRRELCRPVSPSTMEGDTEFNFWHALVRDVAYAELTRAERARLHVATARWIAGRTSEPMGEDAEIVVHHIDAASGLAPEGVDKDTDGLNELLAEALVAAGETAIRTDAPKAAAFLERALALTPPGHPERPEALTRFGGAAFGAGRTVEASEALEEAVASFRARGDLAAAARAMDTLGYVLFFLGDPRWTELPAEALALLEAAPPGPERVGALAWVAAAETLQERYEAGIQAAERALDLAEESSLDRPARALGFRGLARCELGDPGGLEDMAEAMALAIEAGRGQDALELHNNLGVACGAFEGPGAALDVWRAGIDFARTRGVTLMAEGLTGNTLDALIDIGELDEALETAAGLVDRLEDADVWILMAVRCSQARILSLRGQGGLAADWLDWLESTSRGTGVDEQAVNGLGACALARAGLGQDDRAAALLTELAATPAFRNTSTYGATAHALVRAALAIGDRELAERLGAGVEQPRRPIDEHALAATNAALMEARGDLSSAAEAYAEAAGRWERFGVVPEQAFALLGQARCLIGLSLPTEASAVLQRARVIFDRLEAASAIAEIDALIQRATTLSL